MKNILYIPLDERPCNFDFPAELAKGTDVKLIRPDRDLMGFKKQPGQVEALWEWLMAKAKDAEGAILSLDTLLYGGIVPSRLHYMDEDSCMARLDQLRRLKEINPSIKVYAFHLIMRCPSYPSSDEEPDYYEQWGGDIFQSGYLRHRLELGGATEEEQAQLAAIKARLPQEILKDYLDRRAVNLAANRRTVELLRDGTIDFLIIPQDDSAPYGWTALDQQAIRQHVRSNHVELEAYMYPGADEVGCTLLARMINRFKGRRPLVALRYAGINAPYIIPLYEDRMLHESVKYQILAAGGLLCESWQDADFVLCINAAGGLMLESVSQWEAGADYQVLRNLTELTEAAGYLVREYGKPCAIADVAFANGGDLQLIKLLRQQGLLYELAGYAGWNTSSNTLGTVLAQAMLFAVYGNTQSHRNFLAHRYLEDGGYCSEVRRKVTTEVLPAMGYDYFSIDGQRGKVAELVRRELERFAVQHLDAPPYRIQIDDCYIPWSRMFEVGLSVTLIED